MKYVIGVDTGGTFTDVTVVDERGDIDIFKTPSTPGSTEGLINGVQLVTQAKGVTIEELLKNTMRFSYGTTVVTNAIIERTAFGRVGLITTRGFRDTIPMRRNMRVDLFNCQEPFPPAFVRRAHIREVDERVDAKGNIIIPLDEDDAKKAIDDLVHEKHLVNGEIEGIAIALIHSYINPVHEQKIAEMIREAYPEIFVSASIEVCPEIREYERSSTAVFNAYGGKISETHFHDVEAALRDNGLKVLVLIMQSSGGTIGTREATEKPVATLYSGPAGGAIAARKISATGGYGDIISIDMGGTSLDVSLVYKGELQRLRLTEIESYPVMIDRIEIHSIGAGGGSIAWLDPHNLLHVGPHSAGADPGPVCYDATGTEPTVTDADLVLGYLDKDYFLGGKMKVNKEKAYQAIKSKIADPMGMTVEKAALGINRIVDSNMANAMRVLTVKKGLDPRRFSIIAFGGAGASHVGSLFREIGAGQAIVPLNSSCLSAFGLATTDIKHNYAHSDRALLSDLDFERVNKFMTEMVDKGNKVLEAERVPAENRRMEASVDVRYKGQLHEITIPISGTAFDREMIGEIRDSLAKKYYELYRFSETLPIEVVTFRVDAVGVVPEITLKEYKLGKKDAKDALKVYRDACFDEKGFVSTPVYDGNKIVPNNEISGPAIVEFETTTMVVLPGQVAAWDKWLNAVIREEV